MPLAAVALTAGLRAVDPMVCEGSGEAVVDSTDTPTFVVTPVDGATFTDVAAARTRKLASGEGEV